MMKLHLSQQSALSPAASLNLQTQLPKNTVRGWVQKTLVHAQPKKLKSVALTLRWVGEAEGRRLNHVHRGGGLEKDYATNVLTFAYGVVGGELSADIALCWPVLGREAKAQRKLLRHHAAHLIVHGTLHALGFDHEAQADAQVMEALEVKILAELRILNPYLEV